MNDLTLVIGNKNYSSWSLRPWLALRHAGIPFTERLLLLFDENWKEAIAAVSPSGRVPVIQHGERTIWETLAILEYAHELYPEVGLWPEDRNARAVARAVANEMHAGFSALRTHMPMNLRRLDLKGKGRGPGVADDIARICGIWRECRSRYGAGGDFLFGAFGAADAMYAPVVTRLGHLRGRSRPDLRRLQPSRAEPAGLRRMARRGAPRALDRARRRDRLKAGPTTGRRPAPRSGRRPPCAWSAGCCGCGRRSAESRR